jgi:hypothetical protein
MSNAVSLARFAWALGAACAAVACSDMRREVRTPPKVVTPPVAALSPSQVIATAPVRDECFTTDATDTTETAAMKCAEGAASRIADTLQILLSSGRVVKRVDNPQDGESYVRVRYAGRIGGSSGAPAFHVLDGYGYKNHWAEVTNALTGDSLLVATRPVISPDGARFSVSNMSFETCEAATVLQVWRITGDKPVREFDVEPFNCRTYQGWGPTRLEWRSRDTISFLRNTMPRDSARRARNETDTTRILLVHRPTEWGFVPKP